MRKTRECRDLFWLLNKVKNKYVEKIMKENTDIVKETQNFIENYTGNVVNS